LLADLYDGSVADAAARAELVNRSQLETYISKVSLPLDAVEFLSTGPNVKVIAEIKRASPSKGHLADILDPALLAQEYISAGASAISVLTEERKFRGSLADFDAVRAISPIPLLRKDFIANEYQILEARAHGADIVLLIVAGLEKSILFRLKSFIEELGMVALVETHNRAEVEIAGELNSKMVGINARNLSTFETDRTLFAELVSFLPKNIIKIAESAVRGVSDVMEYAAAGADCVLVGEAVVQGNPSELISAFTQIRKA
jgi:indole-3-glycerol phosphate synthase